MNQVEYGTMAWGELTRGNLRTGDRVRQILGLLGIELKNVFRRRRPSAIDLNLDALAPPDSAEARRATELCYGESSPSLAAHCLRSYFWGAIFAQLEGRSYDPELYYVTAMLHDMALTDKHSFAYQDQLDCFAIEGAHIALEEMKDWNWPESRKLCCAEGIALHLNPSVNARKFGNEAYLLNKAAMMDAVGSRADQIHPLNRAQVYARAPRTNLIDEMKISIAHHARHRPHCRIAFLHNAGAVKLAQKAEDEAQRVVDQYGAVAR